MAQLCGVKCVYLFGYHLQESEKPESKSMYASPRRNAKEACHLNTWSSFSHDRQPKVYHGFRNELYFYAKKL